MCPNDNTDTTLVLGASGKSGRRVAQQLIDRGLPVRLGSRTGTPPFDWNDRSTWAPVLEGISRVYISYYPDVAVPGAVETIGAFADLAVDKGARRLVFLAGRGEAEAERAEDAVRDSGADVTIVRATWFAQNFSEGFMREGNLSGVLALPAGDTPEPFVDVDDIADVAVAALTDERHIGQLYELTGPRALTFAQAVEEVAQATGQALRYQPVSLDEYASEMTALGLPVEVIELTRYLFSEVLDGRNSQTTDGVERALGRPARDFATYAGDAAAAGAWAAEQDVAA
jgi:uncharacterized protein YbjT (DUF2867 family)